MKTMTTRSTYALTVLACLVATSAAQAADQPLKAEISNTRSTDQHATYAQDSHEQSTSSTQQVDSFSDWLQQGVVFGELKAMAFNKEFNGIVANEPTRSFGGELQYRSAEYKGFSFGLGEYIANDFGLNGDSVESELPSENVNVLGKAFLQYRYGGMTVRAGRMGLDTPFASSLEGRTLIPALYEGVGATYQLPRNKDLTFSGYRIYKYKPLDEDSFVREDAGSPRVTDTKMPVVTSDGFTTLGVKYDKHFGPSAQAWYYDFDKRAQLAYVGGQLPIKALQFGRATPFIGMDYIKEWDTSDQADPYKNIDADLYSVKLGFNSPKHTVLVAGTVVPRKDDAFQNGGYFSPYSYATYNDTPIATEQPLASLVTMNQPGRSLAGRYIYHDNRFKAVLGLTRYDLDSVDQPYASSTRKVKAGFMILSYDVTDRLNVEFEGDYVDTPYFVTGDFHAERFRISYKFGPKMAAAEY